MLADVCASRVLVQWGTEAKTGCTFSLISSPIYLDVCWLTASTHFPLQGLESTSLLVGNLPSSQGWCYLPLNTLPEQFLLLVSTLTSLPLPVTVSLLKQGAIISDAVSALQSSFLVLTFRIWQNFLLVSSNRSGCNFFLCFLTPFPMFL